jgi:hypothetical protein
MTAEGAAKKGRGARNAAAAAAAAAEAAAPLPPRRSPAVVEETTLSPVAGDSASPGDLRHSNRARKPKIMDVIPSIVNAQVLQLCRPTSCSSPANGWTALIVVARNGRA